MARKLPLPRGWKRRVKSSVIHVLALSHYTGSGMSAPGVAVTSRAPSLASRHFVPVATPQPARFDDERAFSSASRIVGPVQSPGVPYNPLESTPVVETFWRRTGSSLRPESCERISGEPGAVHFIVSVVPAYFLKGLFGVEV